jgi:hypothetical protein
MNRLKFDPYRHKDENQRLDQSILDTMTSMCCKRCCDIVQWKVDFGKYQPQDRPRKCNLCEQKLVAIAYHRICQECAKQTIRCAKCQKPPSLTDEGIGEGSSSGEDDDDDDGDRRVAMKATAQSHAVAGRQGKTVEDALMKYMFVYTPDSDEEFHAYQGLDYRRLKVYKRRLSAMKEKEEQNALRERERRTLLRQQRKQHKGEGGDADGDYDSDEVM